MGTLGLAIVASFRLMAQFARKMHHRPNPLLRSIDQKGEPNL